MINRWNYSPMYALGKQTYQKLLMLVVFSVFQVGCAHSPESKSSNDPHESVNRSIQKFNDKMDSLGLKPAAKGYTRVIPIPVERGVHNFFSNISDPAVAVNQFLQGKFKLGIQDSARFIFNTTFGLGGLINISSPMGLEKHEEDFGQTLAVWGITSGPYINLPLLGPASPRDSFGNIVEGMMNPIGHINNVRTRNRLAGLLTVNKRASLLSAESMITGDRYLFIRDVYTQRREFLIKDGEVEDAFLDDE